jgi:Transcription factor zinc-finger
MADETGTAWTCPKHGVAMKSFGRRSGAWRCPTCRGIFMDTEEMRRRRPPTWQPVLTSVLVSLAATAVARRVRRRAKKQSSS